MTGELRTTAEVARWLDAGLALRRIVPGGDGDPADHDDDAGRVARALAACANELAALPPPGVIADIATLLTGGRRAYPELLDGRADDALQAAIRAYDDDVIARLVATPRFDDVLAAYAHAAPADRAAAVALVVAALCERAGFAGVSVSPAALRRAIAQGGPHPADRADHADHERGVERAASLTEQLAEAYHRLARGARQCRALVDDREVFAVDHLAVLRDLGSRMTATHIAAAAAAITQRLPRRLPVSRDRRGAHDSRFADESPYPAGGFASITPGGATTGNIENLVSSELAYMEDGESVDVFSLRYVEGELLHYTRDDSVFRRRRHAIGVVLGADLEGARVVDHGMPWQRLILGLGVVVAASRWLAEHLADQSLQVRVAFPPGALVGEREIVALLLAGEVARGIVAIVAAPPDDTVAWITAAAGTAIADLVVISRAQRPALPNGVRALHVDLAAPVPVLRDLSPRPTAHTDTCLDPHQDPWVTWCEGAEDLLQWLI